MSRILQYACHGLDKLWKWNVVCFGINMYDRALKAGKKLYIYLYVARAQHVTMPHLRIEAFLPALSHIIAQNPVAAFHYL